MARPAVFISSTYVDLRHVRAVVREFVESIGYEARLFEKGGIGFDYQKPVDESCYDEVGKCDVFVLIIGGRYGAPASDVSARRNQKKYDSITKKEYVKASGMNIPIYIFVDKNVMSDYETYIANDRNRKIKYAHVDDVQVFDIINDIFAQKYNNYIHTFLNIEEITGILKAQWAALFQDNIRRRKSGEISRRIKINSFKLFYYRRRAGMTVGDLSKELNINKDEISRLERLRTSKETFTGYHVNYFPDCDFDRLTKIESLIGCVGKLTAGQSDDFAAIYLEYYIENRGNAKYTKKPGHPMLKYATKIVIFDFDGTIAIGENGYTTWEALWVELGYTANDCAHYHAQFRKGLFSHQEWCNITLEKFKAKGMNRKNLLNVARKMTILPGFPELLQELIDRKIRLYILSGSVKEIISTTIGNNVHLFEEVKANEIEFDSNDEIIRITGTSFDFEGKAEYVKRVIEERKCSPLDVLYIGNAGNDSWVHKSGARTLCVNPTSTDPNHPKMWTESIRMMSDIREILKYVN